MADLAELNLLVKYLQVKAAKGALDQLSTSGKKAEDQSNKLLKSTSSLSTVYSRLTAALTTTVAGFSALRLVMESIKTSAFFERTEVGFRTLTGSTTRAKELMEEFIDFAVRTPFSFKGLSDSLTQMVALGATADNAIKELRILADTSAAFGKTTEHLDRLALAIGQVRAAGVVRGEEMRQFANAGIPAWQILADFIGVTVPEAMKLTERKAVDAATGVAAILGGLEARYTGATKRFSETLTGQFNVLGNELRLVARDVGDELVKALDLKKAIASLASTVEAVKPIVVDVVKILVGARRPGEVLHETAERFAIVIRVVTAAIGALVATKILVFLGGFIGLLLRSIGALRGFQVGMYYAARSGSVLAGTLVGLRVGFRGLLAALGPGGWLLIGLSLAAEAFVGFSSAAKMSKTDISDLEEKTIDLSQAASDAAENWARYELSLARGDIAGQVAALENQIRSLAEAEKELYGRGVARGGIPIPGGGKLVAVDEMNTLLGKIGEDVGKSAIQQVALRILQQNQVNRRALEQSTAAQGFKVPEIDPWLELADIMSKLTHIPVADVFTAIALKQAELGKQTDELKEKLRELIQSRTAEFDPDHPAFEFIDSLAKEAVLLQNVLATPIAEMGRMRSRLEALAKAEADSMREKKTLTQAQITEITQLADANFDLEQAIKAVLDANNEAIAADKKRNDALKESHEELHDMIRILEEHIEVLKLSGVEAEVLAARQEALAAGAGMHHFALMPLVAMIESLTRKEYELTEAQKQRREEEDKLRKLEEDRIRIYESLVDSFSALQLEISLVGKTNDIRERAVEWAKIESDLRELSIEQLEEINRLLNEGPREGVLDPAKEAQISKIKDARDAFLDLLKEQKEFERFADSLGAEFGQAFEDIVFGTESVEEAFENMFKNIARLAFEYFVTRQIASFISGAFTTQFGPGSAKGNVFSRGNLIPFASGGIAFGPTMFPTSRGMGIMGENGPSEPEGILPLGRTREGKLGVRAEGSGGTTINNSFNIQTPDANSFGLSEKQIFSRATRYMGRR